jgi:hypothetical protein
MKKLGVTLVWIIIFLAGCAAPMPSSTPTLALPTSIPPSNTPRIQMLPTWTPSPTPLRKPSPTPRNTSTPLVTAGPYGSVTPTSLTIELLIDRPTYSQQVKPASLVTLEYDPTSWTLNSYYPTTYMGYSLTNRSIYGCKLEPSLGEEAEGYEIEKFSRTFGATSFTVTRLSQAGELIYTNYCTGKGEDATCYRMTPGDDHEGCTQASEAVIASYQLIDNPWYGNVVTSPNRWICQDAIGTVGLCQISYSVPLNALAFTPDGQAWAAGDDGIIFYREGQTWKKANSPAMHPLYDLSFSSSTNGWAVGDGAQVLKWDGNGWKETLPYHATGEGPGGSTQILFAVDAASNKEAWMAGAMEGIDGKNSAYALNWNGADLVEEGNFPECNCGLNAILEVGKDNIFAAGGSDMGAMVFHWDGAEWTNTVLTGADHLYTLIQAPDGTIWTGGIEIARDQSDTRGALFHWDGSEWQRVATPPLTGGIYAMSALPTGQIVLGGEFTALRDGLQWQPITTDIAAFGWIVDIEQDPQLNVWALTHSGNIFKLAIGG